MAVSDSFSLSIEHDTFASQNRERERERSLGWPSGLQDECIDVIRRLMKGHGLCRRRQIPTNLNERAAMQLIDYAVDAGAYNSRPTGQTSDLVLFQRFLRTLGSITIEIGSNVFVKIQIILSLCVFHSPEIRCAIARRRHHHRPMTRP